jgi:hypothetical protein
MYTPCFKKVCSTKAILHPDVLQNSNGFTVAKPPLFGGLLT